MARHLRADQTALSFPTGGYHFPGMGADVEASAHRELFDRVEATLCTMGVAAGSLRALMAGANQAKRNKTERGWEWSGDFPLSMVAQMALGVVLAREFVQRHGAPRVLVGESMGELAAYCAAGALSLEDATRLTWRWAKDLRIASDELSLRMAVVEELEQDELAPFAAEVRPITRIFPRLCSRCASPNAVLLEALDSITLRAPKNAFSAR